MSLCKQQSIELKKLLNTAQTINPKNKLHKLIIFHTMNELDKLALPPTFLSTTRCLQMIFVQLLWHLFAMFSAMTLNIRLDKLFPNFM